MHTCPGRSPGGSEFCTHSYLSFIVNHVWRLGLIRSILCIYDLKASCSATKFSVAANRTGHRTPACLLPRQSLRTIERIAYPYCYPGVHHILHIPTSSSIFPPKRNIHATSSPDPAAAWSADRNGEAPRPDARIKGQAVLVVHASLVHFR